MTFREVIFLIVVAGTVGVAALIVLIPVMKGLPLEPTIQLLQAWGTIYAGPVGLVVGFYAGSERNRGRR